MASLLNENQPTDPISLLPYKKPTRVLRKGVEVHGNVYCRSFPLNSYEAFKSIFFVFFFPFFLHSIQVQIVIKVEPHPGCVK